MNKDISTALTHLLSAILEDCRRIEPALQAYLRVNDERPNINLELLRILSNALSAYGLLEPDKEAGEFHGLPREVCSLDEPAELEIRHTGQDADWDFKPWLSEKLNRMQTAAKDLVGVWITDPRFANERRCRGKLILKQLRCGLLRSFSTANPA
jgi:hypothetical protein